MHHDNTYIMHCIFYKLIRYQDFILLESLVKGILLYEQFSVFIVSVPLSEIFNLLNLVPIGLFLESIFLKWNFFFLFLNEMYILYIYIFQKKFVLKMISLTKYEIIPIFSDLTFSENWSELYRFCTFITFLL